ncbi:MAG: RluA family pseudouridine synthase [Candidatus Kapabacteria bacterium]|nr:RluA family pseudouridine synthase [Candidatus Kapabacteria bacterium]
MEKAPVPVILYQDEAIVVVSKPPAYHTLPDRFRRDIPNLRDWLQSRLGKIYVVHRLDHDTSGVIIFARTADAHRALSLQFEQRTVNKRYHAVVVGLVEQDLFDIDIPLMEDPAKPGRVIPSARGKEALTHVRVMERFRGATLLECVPVTGRQHQIRVHLAAIGHPLLVDPLYGVGEGVYLSALKTRYKPSHEHPERPLIARATLHAEEIAFIHPITQQPCSYVAPYPRDFRALLHALRKYSSFHAPESLRLKQ